MVDNRIHSVTGAKLFLECPEKFRLSEIRRLAPIVEPDELALGSKVHALLATYYRGEDIYATYHETAKVIIDGLQCQADADRAEKGLAILRGITEAYPKWAASADAGHTTLAVEEEGSIFDINCRVDRIFKRGEEVWVQETKTYALGFAPPYEDTGSFDLQGNAYAAKWRAHGICYNLIGKSALRKSQREDRDGYIQRICQEYVGNPTKYFSRVWIPLSNPLELTRDMVYGIRAQEEAAYLASRFAELPYPRNTDACKRFMRPCHFLGLCQGTKTEEHYGRRHRKGTTGDKEDNLSNSPTGPNPDNAKV